MSEAFPQAREALAARDRVAGVGVGYADREICDHLRAALAEVDRLTKERDRWEDTATGRKHDLQNADTTLTTIRFALRPESETVNGWRPPRGVDPIVDLALTVREERDELRAALAESQRVFVAMLEREQAKPRPHVAPEPYREGIGPCHVCQSPRVRSGQDGPILYWACAEALDRVCGYPDADYGDWIRHLEASETDEGTVRFRAEFFAALARSG